MSESRHLEATARKLAHARSRGLVARSPELSAAAAVLAVTGLLAWNGGGLLGALRGLVRAGLGAAAEPEAHGPVLAPLLGPLREAGLALLPLLLAAAAAAWLAGFAQVGPLLSGAAVAPDLERLSPAERLRALFSAERGSELVFSALKLAVLLGVALGALLPSLRGIASLAQGGAPRAQGVLASAAGNFALRMGAALALVGLIDLVMRRVRHARELRMSRRELIEEQRETLGMPEQLAHRRRLRQELRAQAELAGLERASVLLLDAAGRALALAFDASDEAQHAPRVVAKGQAELARRMHATAELRDLPVRWAGPLVGALFPLELTETVPSAHHAAVAELFASLPATPP
jgi:flagellar biosynthesis protein FlhB